MQHTNRLNIPKPDSTDEFYQSDVNEAYDIIDNAYGTMMDAYETAQNVNVNFELSSAHTGADSRTYSSISDRLDQNDVTVSNNKSKGDDIGYGVISGLSVVAQTNPNMTVNASSGIVHMATGNRYSVNANASISVNASDSTKPRRDIIYIDSLGVIQYLAGALGTAAVKGSTTYTITANAVAGDTFTINGSTYTAVASGATGSQFNVGADTTATAANIASAINSDAILSKVFLATSSVNVITLTEKIAGGEHTPDQCSRTGSILVTNGTVVHSEVASATAPNVPTNGQKIYEILVDAGLTYIRNINIIDKRVIKQTNSNLNDKADDVIEYFRKGDFSKYFNTPYKGSSMIIPYTQTGTGTITWVIDRLVADNCNSLQVNPRLNMATQNSNTMTRSASDADVIQAFSYAKSKGMKTMLKCHTTGAVGNQYQILPTDTVAWITDLSSHVMYYVNLLTANNCQPDMVCLVNEAVYQTYDTYKNQWQSLNDSIKAVNKDIITTSASTKDEMDSSCLFDIVDYIGFNLYNGVDGNSMSNERDMKKWMFEDVMDGVDWLTTLMDVCRAKGKKAMITEVGCLPYETGLASPAAWNGTTQSDTAQDLYYKVALKTFMNSTFIDGIFIWHAVEGFTFINRQAENTVKKLFGGDY